MTADRTEAVAWLVLAVAGALAVALVARLWQIQASHECRWDRAEAWEEFGRDGN